MSRMATTLIVPLLAAALLAGMRTIHSAHQPGINGAACGHGRERRTGTVCSMVMPTEESHAADRWFLRPAVAESEAEQHGQLKPFQHTRRRVAS
jgi:hypothetical protein